MLPGEFHVVWPLSQVLPEHDFWKRHLPAKRSRPFHVSSRASEHSPPPHSVRSPSPELRLRGGLSPHLREHERVGFGDFVQLFPPARLAPVARAHVDLQQDRKSTRLNSSHP